MYFSPKALRVNVAGASSVGLSRKNATDWKHVENQLDHPKTRFHNLHRITRKTDDATPPLTHRSDQDAILSE